MEKGRFRLQSGTYIARVLSLLILAVVMNKSVFGDQVEIPRCDAGHCAQQGRNADKMCQFYNKGPGDDITIVDPTKMEYCICACSCVTADTPILMHDGSMKMATDIQEGDTVYSPYAPSKTTIIFHVIRSQVSEHPIIKLTFDHGTIRMSDNHLFILPDFTVITVKELLSGHFVLNYQGERQMVKEVIGEKYSGELINMVLSESEEMAFNHIFITVGIQSGDHALQSRNDYEAIRETIFSATIK